MKNTRILKVIALALFAYFFLTAEKCTDTNTPVSSSGVSAKTTSVTTDQNGWTLEQKNVAARLKMDNTPGAIKHLYVISPMSGEVILYSTVMGKVTSSGKRLAPRTVGGGRYNDYMSVGISGNSYRTQEVIEDDGTYGSSVDYIFWWDAQGRYMQYFIGTGSGIVIVSDQPLPIHKIAITIDTAAK